MPSDREIFLVSLPLVIYQRRPASLLVQHSYPWSHKNGVMNIENPRQLT
jgi:hypothetical protein